MKKILLYIIIVVLAVTIGPTVYALAGYSDEFVSVDVKLEACRLTTCSTSDWYNYSVDATGDGETLTVLPGDTITLRGSTWNSGASYAAMVFSGTINQTNYLETIDAFEGGNEDVDGTNGYYILDSATDTDNTETMAISLSGLLSTDSDIDHPEVGDIKIKLKSDVPDQTVITAAFNVTAATTGVVKGLFVGRAYAADLTTTTVRLLVSNPSVAATAVTPTATAAVTATATVLPQTGASTIARFIKFLKFVRFIKC
jgi:hypothetical protein